MVIIKDNTNVFHKVPYVYIKGAPEYVLDRCTYYLDEFTNTIKPLTSEIIERLFIQISEIASDGKRVIAVARSDSLDSMKYNANFVFKSDPVPNFPTNDLIFISCIAVRDPPRTGVKEAIESLHNAGISVAMITGDAINTAVAIARQVSIISINDEYNTIQNMDSLKKFNDFEKINISNSNNDIENGGLLIPKSSSNSKSNNTDSLIDKLSNSSAVVIDGRDLNSITLLGWNYIFNHKEMIFARTTPEQKLMIVKESQNRGYRVGVTGDGVNDSPALKQADVGIAMGLSGSAVARDAASVVLLDDNFISILKAVEEGRTIFHNLRKVIAYQIAAGCWSELIPVLATFFLGMPQPLSSFLMILISCSTDVFAGIALTYEPAEKEILLEKPRDLSKSFLVDFKLIGYSYLFYGNLQSIGSFINYFIYMASKFDFLS